MDYICGRAVQEKEGGGLRTPAGEEVVPSQESGQEQGLLKMNMHIPDSMENKYICHMYMCFNQKFMLHTY